MAKVKLIPDSDVCYDRDLLGKGVPSIVTADWNADRTGLVLTCLACGNSWDESIPEAPKGWKFA